MTKSSEIPAVIAYARENQSETLKGLAELLRFATISSAYPANQDEFARCTEWLVRYLNKMGFEYAEVIPTDGPPLVYGDWLGAGEDAPTLLVYGHYDVMPVDPIEDWIHPPFQPAVDEKRIYGRGASDDKGQFFAIMRAIEAWFKVTGGVPVNLKVLLEGEEENLSAHLEAFLADHQEKLHCDGIVVADMGGLGPHLPLVEYGNRGNCYMEITVKGPAKDLHSGTYGGAVDNPFNVLTRLLASVQDGQTRRVNVPGFYNRVKDLTPRELELSQAVPITDEVGLYTTGVPALGGEPEYPLKVRVGSRPTFEIHGMPGGYTGPGIKTVIPESASAKISFRLVPDQDPGEIFHMVQAYLEHMAPPTVKLTCTLLGSASPATFNLDAPVMRTCVEAYQRAWGLPPFFVRGGGSLPVVTLFQKYIQPDILLTGFGLPDDGEHSPNESFSLQQFYSGIEMMVHYFGLYPV